jgi:hypothetical protein
MKRTYALLVALSLLPTLMLAQWKTQTDTDSFSGKASSYVTVLSAEQNARLGIVCGQDDEPVVALQIVGYIFDYESNGYTKSVRMRVREDDGEPHEIVWTVGKSGTSAYLVEYAGKKAAELLSRLRKYVIQLNVYADAYKTATFLIPNHEVAVGLLSNCHGTVPGYKWVLLPEGSWGWVKQP